MAEQGIGEQIMFSTMIPNVLNLGASITFACDERLVGLYARSFPEITVVPHANLNEAIAGSIDYHIAAGSLARHVGERAQRDPLLHADPARVQALKDRYRALGPGPVIGIAWHSDSPTYSDRKNIDLAQWRPILQAAKDCTLISLQYGDARSAAEDTPGAHIHTDTDIDPRTDLDDHAAQIAAVDHVVSISNASVHLAGALGVPCSVIVGDNPPWHWSLEGDTSSWYGSLKIFRRKSGEDWQGVLETVAAILHVK